MRPLITVRFTAHLQKLRKFAVHDDGAGIAEEYQERIFGMLQTLRLRDEIESSNCHEAMGSVGPDHLAARDWR